MNLGMELTLNDTENTLDPEVVALSERITPMQSPDFGTIWDMFMSDGLLTTDEYETLVRNYTAPIISITAGGSSSDWDTDSDATALPVSSSYIDRITIGDILLVEDEIVVVKSVDRSGNTIDVYERGAGESSASAHGTSALTVKIIGNANIEGTVNVTAMAEETTKTTNYAQIIEESVDLSKADTDQARKMGRTEPVLKQEALERVYQKLARTAVYGVARVGTSAIPAMTRGLISYLTNITGALQTSVSGAFTETVLLNLLDDVRNAGGRVNAVVMSPKNKRIFNTFVGADQVQVDRSVREGGHVLDAYLADSFGRIVPIVDLDMPNSKVAVVDTSRMSKKWKVNDLLRFEKETNVNSRENKQTLQGKVGLIMDGIGTTHAIAKDLTTS